MLKRRFVLCTTALLAAGALVGVSLGGCADTEGTFYVLNAVSGVATDGLCTFEVGGAILYGGNYEVLGGSEYSLGLVARNALVSTADPNEPQVETNHVEIYAVDVTLVGKGIVGTQDCPSSFTYPSKGFVEPSAEGATATLVIPACTRTQLIGAMAEGESQTVIATFVVHGHTTGGDEVETPDYDFPIAVSRGGYCAAEPADGAEDPTDQTGACGFGVNSRAPFATCEANRP